MTGQAEALLPERLATVQENIREAAHSAGRDSGDITTIVVTKYHAASLVRELAALGVRDVGESRHPEARDKFAEVADESLTWHFVGQVQGKKARQIASYAHVIHSVDRDSLVSTLESTERTTSCFLQINLTEDPARGGVPLDGLVPLAERALTTRGIRLMGVMAMAPLGEDPRRAFSRVRLASERLLTVAPDARWISAGMSGDYRDAILEGATHLRIGSAITGNRPSER